MPFHGNKAGRGRRSVRPPVLRRSVEALERRDLLALVLTPLSFTEGVVFSGTVATFAASDLQGSAGDFTPTISWGDGTTSSGATAVQVVPDAAIAGFDVVALSRTYSQFGTFPVTVTVAGLKNSLVSANGSAAVADAPLTPTGTTFTATEGQLFNGVVGSFQDVNTKSQPGDFTLRIDWGDNQTSLGTAVALPSGQTVPQRYNVTGSHVYTTTVIGPVKVNIVRNSSGQNVTATSTADVIAPTLNLSPVAVVGAPNQAISNVTFATLVDSNTSSTAADFSATIQWGPGLPTTNANVTPVANVPGQYTVNGTFTYPATGIYHPIVTVVRTTLNQTVSTTSTANITTPILVADGTSISPTAGIQFQGKVASFTDTAAGGAASDFTATIAWSSGGPTTQGKVVSTGPGQYDVTGTFIYSTPGTNTATVTITRTAGGQMATATSTADVIAPTLNLFPATVSGAPNQAINNMPFATLVDYNPTSSVGDFSATIQWGPGLPTTTAIVTQVANAPGQYTINGTFTYPAPGVYHPIVTVVRTTLNQSVSTVSTANIAATLTVSPSPPVPLTGVLDPITPRFPKFIRGQMVWVTNQQEPTITGTAEPGASVTLSIRRLGLGDPITIGETVADPNGRWSLVVGPLGGPPFQLYGVASPVANPPTPITLLNGGIPIFVTNRPLHGAGIPGGQHGHNHARKAAPVPHHRAAHGRG